MTPQVVDFNGDGEMDLATGEYAPGNVVWFKGLGKQRFAGWKAIPETTDDTQDWAASTLFLADWDFDGDLDMLIGGYSGHIYLNTNTGTRKEPKYGRREYLSAGGKRIELPMKSHAVAVDWDGDKLLDILAGDNEGQGWFFRRLSDGSLAEGVRLKAGGKDLKIDHRIKLHVCDWNKDGIMDLLVGSCVQVPDRIGEESYTGYVYLLLGSRQS